ncbi:MAG: nucleotidyl transferase AbiEii/AbiGii toxin family protein [Caldilineaceae bacterium]|nr:nucleotidyl transferase AbiEii/AbiGii toxin family protein [Caldilineaceae bacterium]
MRSTPEIPDAARRAWHRLLLATADLQEVVDNAVLVGGTAAALAASHRYSHDSDHVLPDLENRFAEITERLASTPGWHTARIREPVLILGSLHGIRMGLRQLLRPDPLEAETIVFRGRPIRVPTYAEILRIKGFLVIRRNAVRDYVDCCALLQRLDDAGLAVALTPFDRLYAFDQPSGEPPLYRLAMRLVNPVPDDLENADGRQLESRAGHPWTWEATAKACLQQGLRVMDLVDRSPPATPDTPAG